MLGLRTSRGLPEEWIRRHCDAAAVSRLLSAGALVTVCPDSSASFRTASFGHDDSSCQDASGDLWLRIPEDQFFVSDDIIADLL